MSPSNDPAPAVNTAVDCPSSSLCPLNRIRAGTAVRIKKLCANPEISRRLREIGFHEEQIIKLVTCQTNFICQVCNTRLAISGHIAQSILVEPVLQGGF